MLRDNGHKDEGNHENPFCLIPENETGSVDIPVGGGGGDLAEGVKGGHG